ncbi:MAG: hypothetical protein PVSMB8_06210 [Vulcanimicrobiaceae bacterium]
MASLAILLCLTSPAASTIVLHPQYGSHERGSVRFTKPGDTLSLDIVVTGTTADALAPVVHGRP